MQRESERRWQSRGAATALAKFWDGWRAFLNGLRCLAGQDEG